MLQRRCICIDVVVSALASNRRRPHSMHSEIVNMNRWNRAAWSLASASVVAVAALVAGCAKKQPPAPPPAPQAAPAPAPAGPNQDSLAAAQRRAPDAARAA